VASCTVCDLDARPRKLAETLMREKVTLRDVAEFLEWFLNRESPGETPKKVSKSALDRHKDHFSLDESKSLAETGQYQTVEDISAELVRRYGLLLENPDWVPAGKEVREWAALMAKVADIEQRRREDARLQALLAGAAFQAPPPIEVIQVHPQLDSGEAND